MSEWFISLHIIHDEGLISYLGFMATFYASTSGKIFNIGKAINRKTLCYLSHINQKIQCHNFFLMMNTLLLISAVHGPLAE